MSPYFSKWLQKEIFLFIYHHWSGKPSKEWTPKQQENYTILFSIHHIQLPTKCCFIHSHWYPSHKYSGCFPRGCSHLLLPNKLYFMNCTITIYLQHVNMNVKREQNEIDNQTINNINQWCNSTFGVAILTSSIRFPRKFSAAIAVCKNWNIRHKKF